MKVLILAGGGGTRLYPLSTPEKPKQFLPLAEGKPLIINTINRFLHLVEQRDIIIVTGERYKTLTQEILAEYKLNAVNIVCEPCAKNTAPAIAMGVRYAIDCLKASSEEVFFVAPCDHVIKPEQKYLGYVEKAINNAKNTIITLGLVPASPDTGFGYIRAAKGTGEIRKVAQFKEKPDFETAKAYLKSGEYFWNAGMYCFTEKLLAEELKLNANSLHELYQSGYEEMKTKFESCEKISIDYAIAEKTKTMQVIPMELSWSDIGSWQAYYNYCDKDEKGNVIIGQVEAIDCKNCLLASFDTEIKANGQERMIIVSTLHSTLIRGL